ncbi:probable glycerol-3-phosphate acyltransferase 3 [Oryza brachyantha]|uniref:probable glycerol-3-phosphate acyltransferase 3 n=1 Tax=Oryza brachyantha TaxID=4533 RepID=UPI001ADA050C|nr:probable glycerol-3-phosphate acyltransferase 3 [Oryza brachyantha]
MAKKPWDFPKAVLSFRRFLRRCFFGGRHHRRPTSSSSSTGAAMPPADKLHDQTVMVDLESWLLRSPMSAFPYFMVVAVEAGSFLRGLLLLLTYPLLCLLPGRDIRLRAMAMVSFIGLREKEVARIGKAVLPKFFLEEMAMEGLEAVRNARKVVVVTATFPRVMVEGFLKEYVGVDAVIGRELMVVAGRYAGLIVDDMETTGGLVEEVMDMKSGKGDQAVGLAEVGSRIHHLFSYYCKETYDVCDADKKEWQPVPRDKYPRPLIFHDGRLAFKPTPYAAMAMYAYLPWGILLAVFRSLAFGLLPYRVSIPLAAFTGMRSRLIAGPTADATRRDDGTSAAGRLYVCNHRTLLDPITVAAGLNKPVTAVTYSVSPVSELIAPIRTARLTRDRGEDRRRMEALLARGDLVVCPEGTTCREPYLLRFSPLFAELTGEVTPVALETRVDIFYGTSTKPAAKWLDPFYFMMNSRPEYRVEFLERVSTAPADGEVAGHGHSIAAANKVQRVLGEALAFELTEQTRKDKYWMLAGNEGNVKGEAKK